MKKVLLAGLCLTAFVLSTNAQNKTLGVGTTTPNANAALHVESPTGNQGVLFPKLTTAQRVAMSGSLTSADNGLMLYDSDLNTIFVWVTNAWIAQANNLKLNIVSGDSIGVYAKVSGAGGVGSAAVYGETSTAFSAVTGMVTSGFSNGVSGISKSPEAGSFGVLGSNSGGGNAAAFTINNAANTSSAVDITTNGAGVGLSINHTGTTSPTSHVLALSAGANTQGAGVFVNQAGTGRAGQFQIQNATSNAAAIRGFTNGLGNAGFYTISNATNTFAAIYSVTNGTGPAFSGEQAGAGNGIAGHFSNTQGTNTYPAIQAMTKGTGPGMRVIQDPTSLGGGFDAFIQNTASNAIGLSIDNQGMGTTGNFVTNNPSNNATALFTSTNGIGSAFTALTTGTGRSAYFDQNNAGSSSPAVTVVTNSNSGGTHGMEVFHNGNGDAIYSKAGNGSAGNFWSDNGTNPASTIFGYSNSTAGGSALGLMHGAEGNALAIFQGGMRVSTANVSVASITTRAAAYNITGAQTTFTLSFGLSDGEVFFIYNGTASNITVNGVSITSGTGKTCIVLGGTLRSM